MLTNAGMGKEKPEQKKAREQLERNAELVDDAIRSTGTKGTEKAPEIISKDQQVLVTYDQLDDLRADELRPVVPVAVETNHNGGWDYILTPGDFYRVQQGQVCGMCLQWQVDTWTPNCSWRGKIGGCGYPRRNDITLNYVKGKVT